jgi:hypothetical protein
MYRLHFSAFLLLIGVKTVRYYEKNAKCIPEFTNDPPIVNIWIPSIMLL